MAKPAVKKKLDQAQLRELRAIQITIEASEETLQRIAALLLFADHLTPKLDYSEVSLPWEKGEKQPVPLEIDRNALLNGLMKDLEKFVRLRGEADAKELIREHGAERLRDLTDDQLLEFESWLRNWAVSNDK